MTGELEQIYDEILALGGTPVATATGLLEKILGALPTVGGAAINSICNGRLTLTSDVPITVTDVIGATNLYFTPYNGNQIMLCDVTGKWSLTTFTEVDSGAVTVTAGLPYDVFLSLVAGVPTLSLVAWANATTRTLALVTQDGILVHRNDITARYLGTVCGSTTNHLEDSASKRYVWNCYNRVVKNLIRQEPTTTWSYGQGPWRQARASTDNQVSVVSGLLESVIDLVVLAIGEESIADAKIAVGIGINSTTANSAQLVMPYWDPAMYIRGTAEARYRGITPVGLATFVWLEQTSYYTATWYGSDGANGIIQSGMMGSFQC
jgi:hypothetical protein